MLPDASLEDLRLLTADSLEQRSPFVLVLAGQPLLRERLVEPQHYALAQRITVRVRLRTLTDSEVALFLDKHLRAAGAKSVRVNQDRKKRTLYALQRIGVTPAPPPAAEPADDDGDAVDPWQ